MEIVTMIDTIHDNVGNIPITAAKVAGYVTGTPDVLWTSADWAKFPHSGRIRINQGYHATLAASLWDCIDVETGAFAPADVPALVKERIGLGIGWTNVYGTDATLQDVQGQLEAAGEHGWYYGHVDCGLADWSLNVGQAAALVGTLVHGLTCRWVQWASPTSNPTTPVPGSNLTLRTANVDLSAADAAWFPAPGAPAPPPWQATALGMAENLVAYLKAHQ